MFLTDQTVPISGTERWFPLAGRDPTKLKERGEIKLSLLMSAVKEEDRLTLRQSYQQYELCLRALIEQELRIDPVSIFSRDFQNQLLEWIATLFSYLSD